MPSPALEMWQELIIAVTHGAIFQQAEALCSQRSGITRAPWPQLPLGPAQDASLRMSTQYRYMLGALLYGRESRLSLPRGVCGCSIGRVGGAERPRMGPAGHRSGFLKADCARARAAN
jgi:hypothetical protein